MIPTYEQILQLVKEHYGCTAKIRPVQLTWKNDYSQPQPQPVPYQYTALVGLFSLCLFPYAELTTEITATAWLLHQGKTVNVLRSYQSGRGLQTFNHQYYAIVDNAATLAKGFEMTAGTPPVEVETYADSCEIHFIGYGIVVG